MEERNKAVRRIAKIMRKYYFEILDENKLEFRDGSVYSWNSEQVKKFNFSLREAVEKIMEGISKYFVERTSSYQWKTAEKLFHGYNFPYKPGIGFLIAAFPDGLVRLMENCAIPAEDILTVARRFYLSFPISQRRFYLDLLDEIERAKKINSNGAAGI